MYPSLIRSQARLTLTNQWKIAIWITFLAGFFGATLIGIPGVNINLTVSKESIHKIPENILKLIHILINIAGVLAIIQFILGSVIQLGYCRYLLNLVDGKEAKTRDLFSQFHLFKEAFLMNLLRGVYVFLWSLLFVIPGIIATLKYILAPFILLENPGLRPKHAITESKYLMQGYKMNMFLLWLSFIGWSFLCVLTLGIGYFWLAPYMNVSIAHFYRNLRPRKHIQTEAYPGIQEYPQIEY